MCEDRAPLLWSEHSSALVDVQRAFGRWQPKQVTKGLRPEVLLGQRLQRLAGEQRWHFAFGSGRPALHGWVLLVRLAEWFVAGQRWREILTGL